MNISKFFKSKIGKKYNNQLAEDILDYINSEIVPKNDFLIGCNMYELPQILNVDYEYIFKLKKSVNKQSLYNDIYESLSNYCHEIDNSEFIFKILIIINEV